jgi:endonuclease/exonuclease/phosphatase family metal-dependent hydrolase
MHHGHITRSVARGLSILRERIAAAKVPPSRIDETLLIATWNVRELGKHPRLDASLHYLAEVIGTFDLVCLVEVRDDVNDLAKVLQYLGPYWKVVLSDYVMDHGGNRERVAFVYDTRAAVFTGLASHVIAPRKKRRNEWVDTISFWRPPYLASFRAGNFDFVVLGTHVRWGTGAKWRARELGKLADWVVAQQKARFVFDKDLVVVGDFNIPTTKSELYAAVTSKGLRAPAGMLDPGSDLAGKKKYDQILVAPKFPESVTGKGGVMDVWSGSYRPLYEGLSRKNNQQLTWEMSDHLPLWIELNTDDDAYQLDQLFG